MLRRVAQRAMLTQHIAAAGADIDDAQAARLCGFTRRPASSSQCSVGREAKRETIDLREID
jgi:hypothetical protein